MKLFDMIDKKMLSEVIANGVSLRFVEPHIYSVCSTAENINSYDKVFGAFYDLVACNRLYNYFTAPTTRFQR